MTRLHFFLTGISAIKSSPYITFLFHKIQKKLLPKKEKEETKYNGLQTEHSTEQEREQVSRWSSVQIGNQD